MSKVAVSKLELDMRIVAYTGFSRQYHCIEEATCTWLKHNFKGAKAVVVRKGRRIGTDVKKIMVGDQLLCLGKFPSELRRKTTVTKKLVQELKKRGFLEFEVKKPSIENAPPKNRMEAIRRTRELIEKTKKSLEIRDQVVQELESFLDSTRAGKGSLTGLAKQAENISRESLSEAFAALSSLRLSDQTYAHSLDVSTIFHTVLSRIRKKKNQRFTLTSDEEILVSGFVHDIGKATVPKEILDSVEKFYIDSLEMKLIRRHPEHGASLLRKLGASEPTINIAHYHHIKLDGSMLSSYPDSVSYHFVPRETRLLSMADIFQALTGQRSYKNPWTPAKAMLYISNLVDFEHDENTYRDFLQVMGQYPIGSLVELTDGSLAFVTSVPEIDLERPQVVITRNSLGEDLTHHHLIDLATTPDLLIANDISCFEVFGDSAATRFTNLNVS